MTKVLWFEGKPTEEYSDGCRYLEKEIEIEGITYKIVYNDNSKGAHKSASICSGMVLLKGDPLGFFYQETFKPPMFFVGYYGKEYKTMQTRDKNYCFTWILEERNKENA